MFKFQILGSDIKFCVTDYAPVTITALSVKQFFINKCLSAGHFAKVLNLMKFDLRIKGDDKKMMFGR